MKIAFLILAAALFALATAGQAHSSPRDLVRVFTELKDFRARGDLENVYRLIGGHSTAPAEELQYLAAEVHILRRTRSGASVTASFRVEPMGQNKVIYLAVKNSYPTAKAELGPAWEKSEFRIIDELIRHGILPSKRYVEKAYMNNKLHQSSVRLFNVATMSEMKLQKLIEIMSKKEAALVSGF